MEIREDEWRRMFPNQAAREDAESVSPIIPPIEFTDSFNDTVTFRNVDGADEPLTCVTCCQDIQISQVNLTAEQAKELVAWLIAWVEKCES